MPVDDLGQPVEVLVELPGEPRLADPGDAGHRDELRLLLLGAGVEQLLDQAELAVAADEGRLEAVRLERAAYPGDDPERPPELRPAFLALELVRARLLVDDRLLAGAARRLADEHRPGLGRRLDARGGVDEVAGDHAFALCAERHRGLAGEHAGARTQVLGAVLLAERRDRRDEVERRPDRALGVVLGRGRRPPHGHHRVADELLDGPAVQLDQASARVEVPREQLAHLLGSRGSESVVKPTRSANSTETTRRSAAGARRLAGRCSRRITRERRTALVAEFARLVGVPQAGQIAAKAVPHPPQNFAFARFSVPQVEQTVMRFPRLRRRPRRRGAASPTVPPRSARCRRRSTRSRTAATGRRLPSGECAGGLLDAPLQIVLRLEHTAFRRHETGTTRLSPFGRKRSGSKPPERSSSHSMKKPSTSKSVRSASATNS